jgi:beta-lactamase regulating signal transducer with metallopeptidase domain/tetratricopeptide (TPR) repeat protein
MDALFDAAALMLAKTTLIALIARLLIAALPRASAATRYVITVAALIAIVLLPAASLVLPVWDVPVLPSTPPAPRAIASPMQIVTVDQAAQLPPVLRVAATVVTATSRIAATVDAIRASWRGWLLLAIGLVALGLLLRIGIGILGIAWVTRRGTEIEDEALLTELDRACDQLGVTAPVSAVFSEQVSVPLVWGFRRPVLVLPAAASEWTLDALRVVFLHELAHLRRRDMLTLLAMRCAAALYWFHPVVWSLDHSARRDCERACDDLVIRAGTRPSEYADHLLTIARLLPHRDPFGAVTLAMSRHSQLEGRLLSILHPNVRRSDTSRVTLAIVAVAALLIVIPIAALRLTAQETEVVKMPRAIAPHTKVEVVESKSDETTDGDESADTAGDGHDDTGPMDEELSRLSSALDELKAQGESQHLSYEKLGTELLMAGDVLRGTELLREAVRLHPGDNRAWYNLGCAYARGGEKQKALAALEKSIEFGSGSASLWQEDEGLASLVDLPDMKNLMNLGDSMELLTDERQEDSGPDVWRRDLPELERFAQQHPTMGRAFFNVGYARLRAGNPTRALDAFRQAKELGYRPAVCDYNIACCYARLGDPNQAFAWMDKAIDGGLDIGSYLHDDRDLDSLRDDPRFAALKAHCKAKKEE